MQGARCISVVALALAQGGCAVPNRPVSLHTPDVAAGEARLALVRFEDARPEVERTGKAPPFIPLGLWNSRIGAYVTGDDAFIGDVELAVSTAIAEALSGALGPARTVAAGSDPDEVCATPGLRYVAHGAIQHLYATRRQTSLLFVPVVMLIYRNDKGEPLGIASLDLEVRDCQTGEVLLRDRFREIRQLEGEYTLSQAAHTVLRQLANQIRRASRRAVREQGTNTDAGTAAESGAPANSDSPQP